MLDSKIGQLPPLAGSLRLSGLPVAHVRIERGHMTRPDIAKGTVAATVKATPPRPAVAIEARSKPPSGDRTIGGAL